MSHELNVIKVILLPNVVVVDDRLDTQVSFYGSYRGGVKNGSFETVGSFVPAPHNIFFEANSKQQNGFGCHYEYRANQSPTTTASSLVLFVFDKRSRKSRRATRERPLVANSQYRHLSA